MRLVIGEDEPLLREGMRMVLEAKGFDVVGVVGDADALRQVVGDERPDVVITDIRMPPDRNDDGLRAATDLRRALPSVGVIVVSAHIVTSYVRELFGSRPGGAGYLLKHRIANVESFCQAVHHVAEGGTVLDPEVVTALMTRPANDPLHRLTPRQCQVLGLIAEGRSNAAIAATIGITEKAVARHASLIYDALDIAPSTEDHRRVLAVVHLLAGSAATRGATTTSGRTPPSARSRVSE